MKPKFFFLSLAQVTEMLLELCVTELEDVATDSETGRSAAKPVVQESAHPYTDDSSQTGVVRIPGEQQLTTIHLKALLHSTGHHVFLQTFVDTIEVTLSIFLKVTRLSKIFPFFLCLSLLLPCEL